MEEIEDTKETLRNYLTFSSTWLSSDANNMVLDRATYVPYTQGICQNFSHLKADVASNTKS